jgi:hypothetical protein
MRSLAIAVVLASTLLSAGAAQAASIAYVDGEEVWLASLDGGSKVRLSEGEGEWRHVTAADSGRILGVARGARALPGASVIRLWDAQGTRISDGPLPSVVDGASTNVPLALDLSSDGQFLAYGYSKFFSGSPPLFYEGHYVVNADTKTRTVPIDRPNKTPSFFGREVVAVASSNRVAVQAPGSGPFGDTFSFWFDTAAAEPQRQRRVDVAATGTALAFELNDDGVFTGGTISVVPIAGIGGTLDAAAGCSLPVSGLARDVSISQDATRIAWKDDQGVKVAGIPDFSGADTCVLTSPPVVISPTGSSPSIGGADAAAILRARTQAPPVGPGPGPGPSPGPGPVPPPPRPGPFVEARLSFLPTPRLAAAALTSARGAVIGVQVTRAGTVSVAVTVPARRLGRRGAAVVVASGTGTAKKAGKLMVRVKRTKAGRRGAARLRGAQVTVNVVQGTLRASRTVVLR